MDEPTAKLAIAMQLEDVLMLEASGAIPEVVRGSYPNYFQIDTKTAAAKYKWGFRLASSIVKDVEQEASIISRLIKMNPTDNPAFARLAALKRPRCSSLEHVETAATCDEADKPILSKADNRKRVRSPSSNGKLPSALTRSNALNFANISNAELGTKGNYHKKLKMSPGFSDRGRVFTVSSFCRDLAKTPTTATAKPLGLQLGSEKEAPPAAVGATSVTAECTGCGQEQDGKLGATASSGAVTAYTPLFPGEKMDGIIETCQSCSGASGASCTQCQGQMAKEIEDEPDCASGPKMMDLDHDALPVLRGSEKEPVRISREDCQHTRFDRVSTRHGHCEVCCRDDGLYVYIMECRRCSFTSCKLCYDVRAWERDGR